LQEGLNLSFSSLRAGNYCTGVPDSGWVLSSRDGRGTWNQRTERLFCPYGNVGDRLWVRETWVDLRAVSPSSDEPNEWGDRPHFRLEEPTQQPNGAWHYDGLDVIWRADGEVEFCDGDGAIGDMADKRDMAHWKSPVIMPRWASRFTLEITKIRVERLQDISEEDAKAEGLNPKKIHDPANPDTGVVRSYRNAFADSWNLINRKDPACDWQNNPFVWVLEFKKVK
jgi:hypothetical protein